MVRIMWEMWVEGVCEFKGVVVCKFNERQQTKESVVGRLESALNGIKGFLGKLFACVCMYNSYIHIYFFYMYLKL